MVSCGAVACRHQRVRVVLCCRHLLQPLCQSQRSAKGEREGSDGCLFANDMASSASEEKEQPGEVGGSQAGSGTLRHLLLKKGIATMPVHWKMRCWDRRTRAGRVTPHGRDQQTCNETSRLAESDSRYAARGWLSCDRRRGDR